MAYHFFPNEMPDFMPELEATIEEVVSSEKANDPVTKLFSLPYGTLSERLKKAALDLKDTIVRETWVLGGKRVSDYTLYTGTLGTAYLLFKAYQVTKNENDLKLCSEMVKACDSASRGSGRVTIICGEAGVYALGTVVAKHMGDERLLGRYLTQFKEVPDCDVFIRIFKCVKLLSQSEMKLFGGFDTEALKHHFEKKVMELEEEKRIVQVIERKK